MTECAEIKITWLYIVQSTYIIGIVAFEKQTFDIQHGVSCHRRSNYRDKNVFDVVNCNTDMQHQTTLIYLVNCFNHSCMIIIFFKVILSVKFNIIMYNLFQDNEIFLIIIIVDMKKNHMTTSFL